jgi:hypothetical protein
MKQHKIKLVLNSQTIRRLHVSGLKDVQGGRLDNQSIEGCPSDLCATGNCGPTANCRACG